MNTALVAILDGRQVPLENSPGSAVATSVASPMSLAFQIAGIPVGDGRSHYLAFWAFPGFQQYAEVPNGTEAPWYGRPARIGIGVWGP